MKLSAKEKETVVLIHGLWLSGWGLAWLARRLRRAGYAVRVYSYPSTRLDLRVNAELLNRYLRACAADTVHLVGHSLGGVLIRALFHYYPDQKPGCIVTLAAPHGGSVVARRLARSALGRRLLGRCVLQFLRGVPRTWAPPARALGVVSGGLAFGLGRLFHPGLPRPNDGVLTAAESTMPGATDQITLPVAHSGMLFAPAAARQVRHFLAAGRFAR